MSGPVPAAVVFTGLCACAVVTADPGALPGPLAAAIGRNGERAGLGPEAVVAELTRVAAEVRAQGWRAS